MYMYVLRVCVVVIYVDYVLMCVPECLIMKYVPYIILMAFGRHSRWCISKGARTRTHTHTHTYILLHILLFALDDGCAIKTFRWVTALRVLNFDACWVSVDKFTRLFTLPSMNELLVSTVPEEGRALFSSWTPHVFREFYSKFPDVQCLTSNL